MYKPAPLIMSDKTRINSMVIHRISMARWEAGLEGTRIHLVLRIRTGARTPTHTYTHRLTHRPTYIHTLYIHTYIHTYIHVKCRPTEVYTLYADLIIKYRDTIVRSLISIILLCVVCMWSVWSWEQPDDIPMTTRNYKKTWFGSNENTGSPVLTVL